MYKVYELTDKERDKTQDFAGMEIHIVMMYLNLKKNVIKKKRDLQKLIKNIGKQRKII